jgi:four helix bundle protein
MKWARRTRETPEILRVAGDLQDLVAWRESAELARRVLLAAKRIRGVGAGAAADQIARAGESIPANVAEAYGRGLGKDGARFLRVARGSAAELESHLWVAEQTGRLPQPLAQSLMDQSRRVRALIRGLLLSSSARRTRD